MKIQLLYFDGCPSGETALENLKAACALEGGTWPIELVEVRDDNDAAARRFLGSPFVVVNGQDLWTEERQAYFMSCRMYRTPEGLRGWPTVEMLRERLRALCEESGDAYSESDKDLGFAIRNRGFSRFHGQRERPAKASSPEDYLNIYRTIGLLLVCCCLSLLAACVAPSAAEGIPTVRLNDLQPLPPTPPAAVVPLRVAVAAVISPRGNAESYTPLFNYLANKLGRPVEMVQRRTYQEVNDLLRDGQVDVAFVCTSAYVAGRRAFGMQLLAAPQVAGATVYYSYLIVPADSSARSMSDLRGKVFAFTDPMSFSGRVYPTSLVRGLGAEPEAFFSRTFFTYSHDNAMRAVADGLADGAGVDSLVYDFAVAREPALAPKIKVIQRSPPFGIPPVVVGPDVRPQIRADLRQQALAAVSDAELLLAACREGLRNRGVSL